MSQIHQIQFQFRAVEDRLVLKMNTTSQEEFVFLLTRRFVSLLYPILTKILHGQEKLAIHENDQIKSHMLSIQQEEVMQKLNTTAAYESKALSYPLGIQPILLARISTSRNNNKLKLTLEPEVGQGICFDVDHKLIHVLRHLLLDSLEKTDWQLGYQRDSIPGQKKSGSGRQYLH